jgi:hypothetical protein
MKSRPITNDIVVLKHRLAMHERAAVAAKFIATRRRKLSVEELSRIILAAYEVNSNAGVKP